MADLVELSSVNLVFLPKLTNLEVAAPPKIARTAITVTNSTSVNPLYWSACVISLR